MNATATATAPTPTKIKLTDINSGMSFFNPEDKNKVVPLRIVHLTATTVTYRLGFDTQRTVSASDFLLLADYLGFKNPINNEG